MKRQFLSGLLLLLCLGLFGQSKKEHCRAIKKHWKAYKKDFLKSDHAPLDKKGVKAMSFFEPDLKYKVKCKFTRVMDAKPFEMATYSGTTILYAKYGTIDFSIDGKNYQLSLYKSPTLARMPQYREYLFIPFKDLTNGETSYGGGRYLDIKISEIENKTNILTLDFNKAYNPFCAYNDGYHCPIPPTENHLEVPILAGEMDFVKPETK